MGQWWRVVNIDKREWFDTRVFHAKTLQSIAFPEERLTPGGALCYLLRESDRSGGGDLGTRMVSLGEVKTSGLSHEEEMRLIAARARTQENVRMNEEQRAAEYAGRWAGCRITMIGDYDHSGLYDAVAKLPKWTELDYEAFAKEFADMVVTPSLADEAIMAKAWEAQAKAKEAGKATGTTHVTLVLDDDGGFSAIKNEEGKPPEFEHYDKP